ncbi:MAG: hypothetical protein AB2689_28095 [Candidatus Thiodiazotropha taylori]
MNEMNAQFAGSSFVVVGSVLVLLGYLLQSVAAFAKAQRSSVLVKTFSLRKYEQTWLIVATIFFGPLIISWVSNIDELLKINEDLKASAALILSMLLIFVTLEFSLLASLNKQNKAWQQLILIALILDVASVVVVTVVKNINPDYINLVFALGVLSFISSFMIILFAHIAGVGDE